MAGRIPQNTSISTWERIQSTHQRQQPTHPFTVQFGISNYSAPFEFCPSQTYYSLVHECNNHQLDVEQSK